MSDKKQVRYIFVKDTEQSKLGFASAEEARLWAVNKFEVMDTDERRVRVRLRQRTGFYDVVVKTRREVPAS